MLEISDSSVDDLHSSSEQPFLRREREREREKGGRSARNPLEKNEAGKEIAAYHRIVLFITAISLRLHRLGGSRILRLHGGRLSGVRGDEIRFRRRRRDC